MAKASWHRQVDTCRGFEVDAGLAGVIEACWDRGWTTRYSCQGGAMWGTPGPRLAYIMFADRESLTSFIDVVTQRLSRDVLAVDEACEAVVRFEPSLIPEIERVLSHPG
ncbi:hypothetical protein [Gordonia sp. 852002-10350_SCH5691597]|uniref:hypothetical protein n=1 Tax=Gordonia sp. 852002-10350_SCH5691597 TaxID=1834085 RepID=UPI0007EA8285|nr:hypothetical protein [Gordonia sp. 852002-10350_SCH5691597]OBA73997.1 hypothetical protein A5777_09570 [Gordonia sp. 852002-10350_SCH5691597]